MRVVVDTNVFISAALKEKSIPGMAAHIAAESGVLLKSTITEQELFVTLARPRLASLIPPHFRDWLSELLTAAELVTSPTVSLPGAIRRTTNFWSWQSTAVPI
ncbi:MAG TPA: hypothetical protein VHT52_23880 [Stellaceae bacterium]|jgi:predicted nucleic acid-binding protein|nr:hypothetical protein [Stellaceae bacterium]